MNLPSGFRRAAAAVRKPLQLLLGPTFERVARAPVEPGYRDRTQFGVECGGTLLPSAWDGKSLPIIAGRTRIYDSLQSTRLIAHEQLIVTFSNEKGGQTSVAVDVEHAGDLLLIAAFAGKWNMFPTAPGQDTGISGSSLSASSLASDVKWPIPAGADMTVVCAIRPSALYRAEAPDGFTTLASIRVIGCLTFFGTLTKE